MQQFDHRSLEEQQNAQRATIFRVYNYYRLLIGFLFLFLFLDPNLKGIVGEINPDLFRNTIITYLAVNVVIGIATLFISVNFLARTAPAFVVLIGDIIALTLLMSASGGVTSGLGNFLFFTLAFAGGLVHGRVSTVLPAIAFILTICDEFYLFFLEESDTQSFFQAGLLGIVYFVTNILFQTLSNQLRSRQSEVYTLEKMNQIIIEGMSTGVVILNNENQARLMNNAAERFLVLPDLEVSELRSDVPQELLEAVDAWQASRSNGDTQREAVFSLRESGMELRATISELPSSSRDKETLVFLQDNTEVQRQAQQLKLASLGRLSAGIAHEIRNPLGAISHAAQLLQESPNLDKGDQRLCDIVQDHSIRMNDVIENVLQMSRREAPERVEINVKDWLEDFVSNFQAGVHETADITVEVEDANITLFIDPSHLNRVMTNLCQNGLRYSEKAAGEAKLLITCQDENLLNLIHVDVIDYGTGVRAEDVNYLFEPFYTTESAGTGLGLYLSRELCAANDARLSYRQAVTGGAMFRISARNL